MNIYIIFKPIFMYETIADSLKSCIVSQIEMNLNTFINLLRISVSSNNNESLNANEVLSNLKKQNLISYINYASLAIISFKTESEIVYLALAAIKIATTPTLHTKYHFIKQEFFKEGSESIRENIHDALLISMNHSDLGVRRLSAIVAALIINIEQHEWPDFFKHVLSIATEERGVSGKEHVINIFKEIFSFGVFRNSTSIPNEVNVFFSHLYDELRQKRLVIPILECMNTMLDQIQLVVSECNSHLLIPCLGDLLGLNDLRVTNLVFQFLTGFMDKLHSFIMSFEQDVRTILHNVFSSGNLNLIITSLYWFNKLIKREISFMVNDPDPNIFYFSQTLIQSTLNYVLNLLKQLKKNYVNLDFDPDRPEYEILKYLKNLFKIYPLSLINILQQYINTLLELSDENSIICSVIALLSMCTKTPTCDLGQALPSFIFDKIVYLCRYIQSENLLINILILHANRKFLKLFPLFLNNPEKSAFFFNLCYNYTSEDPYVLYEAMCTVNQLVLTLPIEYFVEKFQQLYIYADNIRDNRILAKLNHPFINHFSTYQCLCKRLYTLRNKDEFSMFFSSELKKILCMFQNSHLLKEKFSYGDTEARRYGYITCLTCIIQGCRSEQIDDTYLRQIIAIIKDIPFLGDINLIREFSIIITALVEISVPHLIFPYSRMIVDIFNQLLFNNTSISVQSSYNGLLYRSYGEFLKNLSDHFNIESLIDSEFFSFLKILKEEEDPMLVFPDIIYTVSCIIYALKDNNNMEIISEFFSILKNNFIFLDIDDVEYFFNTLSSVIYGFSSIVNAIPSESNHITLADVKSLFKIVIKECENVTKYFSKCDHEFDFKKIWNKNKNGDIFLNNLIHLIKNIIDKYGKKFNIIIQKTLPILSFGEDVTNNPNIRESIVRVYRRVLSE